MAFDIIFLLLLSLSLPLSLSLSLSLLYHHHHHHHHYQTLLGIQHFNIVMPYFHHSGRHTNSFTGFHWVLPGVTELKPRLNHPTFPS